MTQPEKHQSIRCPASFGMCIGSRQRSHDFRKGRLPLMEWSGRAPAPPASDAGIGASVKRSTAMSNKSIATIATMGIDIGKNSFHVVGLDQRGAIVLRQK